VHTFFVGKDDGTTPSSYDASTKAKAIRLVREHASDYPTEHATITTPQLGNLDDVRFWERNGSGQLRAYAASSGQIRSDTVSLTVHSALTSTYIPHQVRYSNVCVVRDEEAAGSNPATPTQVTGHSP